MAETSVSAFDRCIYCGTTGVELSNEHIVPEGLGGDKILPNASCAECCVATSRIEARVLRQSYGLRVARSALGIGRRRKKEKPTAASIETQGLEGRVKHEVPLTVHPIPMQFPLFDTASVVSGATAPTGVRLRGWHAFAAGVSPTATLKYLGAKEGYLRNRNYDHDFAKLVAKVAWCSWVAEAGRESVEEPWLVPFILGRDSAIGKMVGTLDYALVGQADAPCMHSVYHAVWERGDERVVVARVQFFLQLTPSPTYAALIGRLPDDADPSERSTKWKLATAGMIGRPLKGALPRWVGTTMIGKRENAPRSPIVAELRAIGLAE